MKTQKQREAFIVHMLNRGFENAAKSFSKIVNRNVKISTAQSVVIRHDTEFSYISEEVEDAYLLTTQLMGDFSGKSYLIISQHEAEEIFRATAVNKNDKLRDALLLEIDNILSASVISEISNSLNSVVYGDVPKIKKVHSNDINDYINSENGHHEPFSIVYSVATFKFDNHDQVHPQFIWKLSSHVFNLVPEQEAA